MKKLFIVILTLIMTFSLTACSQAKKATIKNVTLTEDEQRIANLNGDIVRKFSLQKGKIYDINMYLYKSGTGENVGGIYGINPKKGEKTVYISGNRTDNAGFMWGLSCGGSAARFPAPKIDDDRTFTVLNGSGQEKIKVESGKEYVLVFAALKEGTKVFASETDVFYTWDVYEDKSELMSKFDYAYVVTIKLSDMPGNV